MAAISLVSEQELNCGRSAGVDAASGGFATKNLDDLLFGESALTHVRLPKERTLPKTEGI